MTELMYASCLAFGLLCTGMRWGYGVAIVGGLLIGGAFRAFGV